MLKMARNPFVYTAIVELMPHIIKLADQKTYRKEKSRVVEEKDMELALKDPPECRQRAQCLVIRQPGGFVVAGTHMAKAGVPVEGGDGKGHGYI